MATAAILVNGLPGSGKSTLAVKLAVLLGCPVLSKDAVKESLADLTGETIPSQTLGGIAMDTVWSLAAEITDGVVIDAFWYPARDQRFAERGVLRSGATRIVELWCEVEPELARDRYEKAVRHSIHGTDFSDWVDAAPLGLWPVVRVDTSTAVDYDALLPALAAAVLG